MVYLTLVAALMLVLRPRMVPMVILGAQAMAKLRRNDVQFRTTMPPQIPAISRAV